MAFVLELVAQEALAVQYHNHVYQLMRRAYDDCNQNLSQNSNHHVHKDGLGFGRFGRRDGADDDGMRPCYHPKMYNLRTCKQDIP